MAGAYGATCFCGPGKFLTEPLQKLPRQISCFSPPRTIKKGVRRPWEEYGPFAKQKARQASPQPNTKIRTTK